MTISQQTTSLLDTTREAGPDECMEAVLTVRDTSQSFASRAGEQSPKESSWCPPAESGI
jgi:hypothetical protein